MSRVSTESSGLQIRVESSGVLGFPGVPWAILVSPGQWGHADGDVQELEDKQEVDSVVVDIAAQKCSLMFSSAVAGRVVV